MQKYNIFSKYHNVCITNQQNLILKADGKDIIECDRNNILSIDFSNIFKEEKGRRSVIIYVKDMALKEVFLHSVKQFFLVKAAGGLVRNQKNELLFIFRNDKWDLPKGHKEANESIETAAIREVEEECGLTDLVIKEKYGITYHIYEMNNRQEIKETHWYSMETKSFALIPQKEEGITEARWIGKEEMGNILSNTYLNIKELLKDIQFI